MYSTGDVAFYESSVAFLVSLRISCEMDGEKVMRKWFGGFSSSFFLYVDGDLASIKAC